MKKEIEDEVDSVVESGSNSVEKIKKLPAKIKQAQDCLKEKFGDIDFETGNTKLADGMNSEGSAKMKAIADAINSGNYSEAKTLSNDYVKSIELTFGSMSKLDEDLDAFLKLCKEVKSLEAEVIDGIRTI